MRSKRAKVKIDYWRVFVTYTDGEMSGNRVFKDRAKAELWAKRQEESPAVKGCRLAAFTREVGDWRKRSQ